MRALPLLLLAACGPAPLTGIANVPGGNPLNPEVALLPFPSDLYLRDGHVTFPVAAMPIELTPEDFARADGFSRATPIVALLPGGVDPTSLPDPSDTGATLGDDSPLWLVRAPDGVRVPVLAEVDQRATAADRRTLILRPHVALDPATTYFVVISDRVRRADGELPAANRAFTALRDDVPTDSDEVEAQRDDFAPLPDLLATLPVAPEEVVLAWPFTTRSEGNVVRQALSVQDAFAEAELSATIDRTEVSGDQTLVWGTMTVPDFLGDDHRMQLEADGSAKLRGTRDVEWLVTVPSSVTGPRPTILFGHGFFSSIEEPTWSSLASSLEPWQMSAATVSFIGFNERDQVQTFARIGQTLANLTVVADEQLQSHGHFTALARLLREGLAQEITVDDGAVHPVDPDALPYMGISNGGTQGLVILATSPVFERGALVVGGGGWSHMMQRAVQWDAMSGILTNKYPDPAELQAVLGLSQLLLDPVDAMNYAPRLVNDRFDGRPPLELSMHVAVGDCQVSNLVSEWVARAADVPVVVPAPYEPWGLRTVQAPTPDGALGPGLFLYDEGYPALPDGNVSAPEDNGAHETIRRLDAYRSQLGTFLETGRIVQVCDGACDPD